ncbi:MAG: response regulator [Pseudomonadota bacterium]|uniref:response regulator n=1 Tax=Polaromonas sp. TaxID=1869339 RepID=UPI001823C148|nr:response regulator [Polaromonas sp.]MBA3592722.1 response regulator [Polaromonas sp.]MDQ3272423.1 response regulator [Pseudomonadota bacterium]
MSFPLFRRPGAIVFLDDDPDYLEMLAMVLPRQWHIKLYLRPQTCIHQLQQEPPLWEADAWAQQEIIDNWRAGSPLIPQILQYWAAQGQRYDLSQVCVFDYAMPGMDGLQALSELTDWSGGRILLTGQADEHVAVSAFNRGLIDQFIAKQTPDISQHLISVVQRMLDRPQLRHSQTWRAALTQPQHALLQVPSVARQLSALAANHWVEHVVIGQPFGILGMEAGGGVSWLQLESASGLVELAELAESQGVDAKAAAGIREGRHLVDLELQQALGRSDGPRLLPAFSIGHEGAVLAALFPLDIPASQRGWVGYKHWLKKTGPRKVQD